MTCVCASAEKLLFVCARKVQKANRVLPKFNMLPIANVLRLQPSQCPTGTVQLAMPLLSRSAGSKCNPVLLPTPAAIVLPKPRVAVAMHIVEAIPDQERLVNARISAAIEKHVKLADDAKRYVFAKVLVVCSYFAFFFFLTG